MPGVSAGYVPGICRVSVECLCRVYVPGVRAECLYRVYVSGVRAECLC